MPDPPPVPCDVTDMNSPVPPKQEFGLLGELAGRQWRVGDKRVSAIHYYEWIDGQRAIRFTEFSKTFSKTREDGAFTEFRPTSVPGVLSACRDMYRPDSPYAIWNQTKVLYHLSPDGMSATSDLSNVGGWGKLEAVRLYPSGVYEHQSAVGRMDAAPPKLRFWGEPDSAKMFTEVKGDELAAAERQMDIQDKQIWAEINARVDQRIAEDKAKQRAKDRQFWENMNAAASGLAQAAAQTSREYQASQADVRARNERLDRAFNKSSTASSPRPASTQGASPGIQTPAVTSPTPVRVATGQRAGSEGKSSSTSEMKTSADGHKVREVATTSDDDAMLCVGQPTPGEGTMCKGELTATVTNTCGRPVDVRVCMTTKSGKWDCRATYGVAPGKSYPFGWCHGTGQTFYDARYSTSKKKLANPF
ncbi:hypothetical protein GCM10027343_09690 [Noviherbaspirillum agri]